MNAVAATEVPPSDASPAVMLPDRRRRSGTRGTRTAVVAGATGAIAIALVLVRAGWNALRIEPVFDEMWRLDLIRSTRFEPALPGVTPIPPGWVGALRALSPALGDSTAAYRLVSLLVFGLGIAALVVLLREWCRPRQPDHPPDVVALAIAATTALSLAAFSIVAQVSYLNQYLFEVTYGVVLTTSCVLIGRHRVAWPVFLVGVAAAPLFVIAPLALLPPLLVAAAWWAATSDSDRRSRRVVAVLAAGTVSALLAVAVYLGMYRGVSDVGGLKDLWAGAALSSAGVDLHLVPRTLDLLRAGVFGEDGGSGIALDVLAALVLSGSFAIGAVTITRRWAWYPLLLGGGWLTLLVGGGVTDGPVTPVRVTIGFYWLVFVTIALGAFQTIAWGLGRIRVRPQVQVGAIAVSLAVLLGALWPTQPAHPDDAFARGLLGDLNPVAASSTSENLVLTYHFMAHAYTHDRFVNRPPHDRDYVVLGQRGPRDRRLLGDVDSLVRRHLPDGGTLWCIVPYAYGPERSSRACRVDSSAREVARHAGTQALVIGYRIAPSR